VDVADNGGLGQDQQVVVALEVVRMILEPLAAIIGFLQLVLLNRGAIAAVKDEDAFLAAGGEFFSPPRRCGSRPIFWIPACAGMTSSANGHFVLWTCT